MPSIRRRTQGPKEAKIYRARREAAPGVLHRGRQRAPRAAAARARSCSRATSLYDIENVTVVHHANQALKAHKLFLRDRDYIVKGGEVIIIDEFTGRMMQGRRYSDGLHQALEAKEHVTIQPENQTLASITFQNYFRLYEKLAGMTGTAATEANEFLDIYKLDVLEVPTNMPVDRTDEHDEVYRTVAGEGARHRRGDRRLPPPRPAGAGRHHVDREVRAAVGPAQGSQVHPRARPVLQASMPTTLKDGKEDELKQHLTEVGAYLDELGRKNSGDPVPHQVLNARYHEQEAHIIAQAGVPGTVTIATNMAGRGTDIQLGGNDRYRARDWLKEELDAGQRPGARRGRRSASCCASGSTTCSARRRRVDRRAASARCDRRPDRRWSQGAGRRTAASQPRERRAEAPARSTATSRSLAQRRSRDRQGVRRQAQGTAGPTAIDERGFATGSTGLRDEARDWLRQQAAPGASARSTRPCSASCAIGLQRLDRPRGGGRPQARRRADCRQRAEIVATFNRVKAKCAEIQADCRQKKKKAMDAGGLYVIGTERHESRRIDNQLRGRSGRQGDPGPLQVLPVAGRRPDAHLRVGPHGRRAAEARPAGRRGDHASLDQQGPGEGAAEGRGAQLRFAQVRAQVRRRDE